jgi:ribosomal-protein-alanine N-acetyltransferase
MIINNNPFPLLTTERLILRRLDMDDAETLFQLRTNKEVNKYLDRPLPASVEEVKAYIKMIDGLLADSKGVYWVICLKTDNKLIGAICMWNFKPEKDMTELGYELRSEFQGRGLMQEAIEKIIAYGFNDMRLKTITALPSPENERSVALLKRNGFRLDTSYEFVNREDAEEQAVYFLIN